MQAAEAGRKKPLSDKSAAALNPAAISSTEVEPKSKTDADPATLGKFLAEARERRGVSCEQAIRETKIPTHYVQMMESNDYSLISDQLYVLPFLRRYAEFLKLDPEAITMRFVREVQRADNTSSGRSIEPIEMDRPRAIGRRRGWSRPVVAAALLAAIWFAWIVESRHHRAAVDNPAPGATSDQNASPR